LAALSSVEELRADVPAGGFGYITNSSGISGSRNGQLV